MSTIIRERMKELKLTDAALAVASGCDRSMVNRVKFGKAMPSLPVAVKMAETLKLPVSMFITEEAARKHAAKAEQAA